MQLAPGETLDVDPREIHEAGGSHGVATDQAALQHCEVQLLRRATELEQRSGSGSQVVTMAVEGVHKVNRWVNLLQNREFLMGQLQLLTIIKNGCGLATECY